MLILSFQDEAAAKFRSYLMSFEGGSIKCSLADKHAAQVLYILKESNADIENCTSDVSALIQKKMSTGDWAPNTCKIYLHSLKLFLKYVKKLSAMGQMNSDEKKIEVSL